MPKFALVVCAVLALCAAGAAHADKTETIQFEEKLPKQSDLKFTEGAEAGHKTPAEVVARAIKAAKDGKLADLKACLDSDNKRSADENSYRGNGQSNVKEVANYLATYNAEGLKSVAQNTVGTYAIVLCTSPLGTHVVRTVLQAQELPAKEGEEAKPGPKNWYVKYSMFEDFEVDVNAPQVKVIIDSISKGDVAKLKEFLDPFESRLYDFISGVKDGADPYGLLAQKLKAIITTGTGRPVMLYSLYSSQAAFWFSHEGKDAFIILNFQAQTSWEDKKKSTDVKIALSNTASFHAEPASQFNSWVQNWSW